MDPLVLIIAWLVTAAAAAQQGTIGFGFAVLSVPILSLVSPELTPVPQILLAFPMTLYIAWRERSDLDLSGAAWIIVGRLPGAVIGAWLLATVTRRTLNGLIAVVVLLAIIVLASGYSIRMTKINEFVAGVASGIGGTTSAIGGPPLALLYRDSSGATLRSSLGAIFAIGVIINVTTLGFAHAIHTTDLTVALLLSPALVAGLYASRFLKGRVEGAMLRRAIYVVSALAAVGLGVQAAFG